MLYCFLSIVPCAPCASAVKLEMPLAAARRCGVVIFPFHEPLNKTQQANIHPEDIGSQPTAGKRRPRCGAVAFGYGGCGEGFGDCGLIKSVTVENRNIVALFLLSR